MALGVNLLPSITFPDFDMTHWLIRVGLILSLGLVGFTLKEVFNRENNWFRWILITGVLAGTLNSLAYHRLWLRNIAIPLYIPFITPFYGINKLLEWRFGDFSSLVAIGYAVLLFVLYIREHFEK